MTSTRKSAKIKAEAIAAEIRTELRSILRVERDLYVPIQRFESFKDDDGQDRYYVMFDMHPRRRIKGLKLGGTKEVNLPDEAIFDRVYEFAKAVWHLKDRLHQYAVASAIARLGRTRQAIT